MSDRAPRGSQKDRVLAYVAEHPGAQPGAVAKALGLLHSYVHATFKRQGIPLQIRAAVEKEGTV
jgi:hypothetical protein